jgi:hypothetical protein
MAVLDELSAQARRIVSAACDDPEARYDLRVRFYEKYGFLPEGAGYGNSELAFMRWEIERGLLAEPPRGSRWWREVNASLLFDAQLAALLHEAAEEVDGLPLGVQRWLGYLDHPSSGSWYVAHNGSIVDGYLRHLEAAHAESRAEQTFMNIVLYRVLYAGAMVKGSTFLGFLGRLMADPILPAVDVITHLADFYPRSYPLTPEDALDMEGRGEGLLDDTVRLFDDVIILPHVTHLYDHSATLLQVPLLRSLLRDGRAVYPHVDIEPEHRAAE